MKKIYVHTHSESANLPSGAHLDAELKAGKRLCNVDLHLHVSFEPGDPAFRRLSQAIGEFTTWLAIQKHITEDHTDGSVCPFDDEKFIGMDFGAIEASGVVCKKGE